MQILISGFNGKMGNAIRGLDIKFDNLTFHDIKKVDLESELKFDLIIDFSSSSFTSHLIERALELELPILIGTTGLDKSQMQSIKMASQKIPVLFEANFSKGIKLLKRSIKDFLTDNHAEVKLIKIYESHHSNKQDIPSGTALLLKNFILSILSNFDEKIEIYSKRANEIFGIHRVEIVLENEEAISFTHNAEGRDIFAYGAIEAAFWLLKQDPGFYELENVN